MTRFALLFCASGLLCFGQASNFGYYAPKVEFEGRFWAPESSPQLKIEATRIDQAISFGRDLGTGDPRVPDLRLTFRPGNNRLQIGFVRFSFTGDETVTRTLEFNGSIYTVGTRVVTDAKVNDFKVGWSYALVRVADGRFKLGPVAEAHALWWDASLAAPVLEVRADDKRTVGFPTVGMFMEILPHRSVAIFAEASGITAGDYGRFYNVEAGARISPVQHLNLLGGYRIFDLNPRFNGDYARLRLAGPFVGASVSF